MSMFGKGGPTPPPVVAPPTTHPLDAARQASIVAAQQLLARPKRDRSSLVIDPATPSPIGVGINTGQ